MGNLGAYPEVTHVGNNSIEAGFIEGELFLCDAQTIRRLDILEDNGVDYQRELIQVVTDSNDNHTAWIYLWQLQPADLVPPIAAETTTATENEPVTYAWQRP